MHAPTDTGRMVKVCMLQAFVDLSAQDSALLYQNIAILEQVVSTGSPVVKSRGGRLLHQLTNERRHEERKST